MSAETVVSIPGTFCARYENGEITSAFFMPAASDAGYFGPAAEIIDLGDEATHVDLDVEKSDGPFWRAMQSFLASSGQIGWEE